MSCGYQSGLSSWELIVFRVTGPDPLDVIIFISSKAHGISSRWLLKEDVGGLQTCHVEKALLKRVGLQESRRKHHSVPTPHVRITGEERERESDGRDQVFATGANRHGHH